MTDLRIAFYAIASNVAALSLMALVFTAPEPLWADDCPDAWITAKVKAKLLADDAVGAFKVGVDTEECVVTLSGCMDSRQRIKKAAKLASSVKKVKLVKNHLKLCPSQQHASD
ncbi:MAG: BON domain-containing protein [Acidobacteriota bacterium]